MMKGKFDEKTLAKTVKALNVHLPVERKTLAALLTEEKPAIEGRSGAIHRIKRDELEELAQLVPKEAHGLLRLPIYLEFTPDYGRGIARVYGKLECAIVRRILGKEPGRGEGDRDDVLFIYRDDVRRVRRKLPTTTEYAFFYTATI